MERRRHDLDACVEKAILNIGAQIGVGEDHQQRLVGVGVDLVLDEGIIERVLQNERRRGLQDVLRLQGGFDQQLVYLTPRLVVAEV